MNYSILVFESHLRSAQRIPNVHHRSSHGISFNRLATIVICLQILSAAALLKRFEKSGFWSAFTWFCHESHPGVQALHWGMIHPSVASACRLPCLSQVSAEVFPLLSTKVASASLPNALQTLQSKLLCSRSRPSCPVHETKVRRRKYRKVLRFSFDELNSRFVSFVRKFSHLKLLFQFRALAPWLSPVSVFSCAAKLSS